MTQNPLMLTPWDGTSPKHDTLYQFPATIHYTHWSKTLSTTTICTLRNVTHHDISPTHLIKARFSPPALPNPYPLSIDLPYSAWLFPNLRNGILHNRHLTNTLPSSQHFPRPYFMQSLFFVALHAPQIISIIGLERPNSFLPIVPTPHLTLFL